MTTKTDNHQGHQDHDQLAHEHQLFETLFELIEPIEGSPEPYCDHPCLSLLVALRCTTSFPVV